jgi:hypothetical protein
MKTGVGLEFEKKRENTKKRKSYFTKLLEMQLRKTDSDRRREIFGMDPLLVRQK